MKFCQNCGKEINEGADVCLGCGKQLNKAVATSENSKSKIAAGLLALFLGTWGVHNFYLGYTGKAVAQLVLTLVGYLTIIILIGFAFISAVAIWAFVEAIMIFAGSIDKDAKGNPLVN